MRAPRNRDQGFTLVEVIVVVCILGLVVGVLGSALRVGVHAGVQGAARLDVAHDAELLSNYLLEDVANASVVDTAAASCVASPMLRLEIGGEVAYRVNADHTLTRHDCASGGSRIVARNLGATAPTVTCVSSCGSTVTRVVIDIPLCSRLGETDSCDTATDRDLRLIGRPRAG